MKIKYIRENMREMILEKMQRDVENKLVDSLTI